MKTYEIEFMRVSYVTLTVEAENRDVAEDAAWLELQIGDYDCNDMEWHIESIEEFELATDDSRSYGPHFSKVTP